MPYIANPLEGIPLVNTFITDQSLLGTTPATDDVLIIFDQSATALKQLTISELQDSITATVTGLTDTTISSVASGEVLKWNGSAWINQTLAEANILPVAGPTFTGVLTVGSAVLSEADLEQIDDLTAGTAVASKALVVDSNKDIGTIRNLTIDGTFSDGNYTFDTSGNVSGLGTIASGAITSSGIIKTDATTNATSITDGSLQTDGGLSVTLDAILGDDLTLISDAAVLNFGVNSDVSLTHVHDTGLLLNSSRKIQFGDAGTFIHQSADGVLTIESDTTVDINGAVVFAGALSGITTLGASGIITSAGLTMGSATMVEADLERVEDITPGTAAASKALVLDGSTNITGIGTIGSGAITSTGIVTGTGFTAGNAVLAEAELELLDGITTVGTAVASKVVTADANVDTTGQRNLTISGELDAATGDFSGAVDIAGALTLSGADMNASDQNITAIKTATFTLVNGGSASSGTIALNWATGMKQYVTLSGNVTITMAAPAGPGNVMLKIVHSGGGRTVTWSDSVTPIMWAGGEAPTLADAAGTDIVAFFYDGTNFYGSAAVAFA